MSSIDSLSDVDTTTTPPSGGQTLLFDAADGLWKPADAPSGGAAPAWEHNQGTVTYPAGDNGWTHVDTSFDVGPLHIANSSDASAAAEVAEFTVTEAMLGTIGFSGLESPYSRGLYVSMSMQVETSATRAVRVQLSVNGVLSRMSSISVSTARRIASGGVAVGCDVGDVVKIFAWRTQGDDGVEVTRFRAFGVAPTVALGADPSDTTPGVIVAEDIGSSFSHVNLGAPTGVLLVGSTSSATPIQYTRQQNDTGTSLSLSTYGVSALRNPVPDGMTAPYVPADITTNATSNDEYTPMFTQHRRIADFEFRRQFIPL